MNCASRQVDSYVCALIGGLAGSKQVGMMVIGTGGAPRKQQKKGGGLGYYLIYMPEHPNSTKDGYVMEHRLVMEKYLNRFLNKNEIVHHVNGDPIDNRIENLQVVTKSEHVIGAFEYVAAGGLLISVSETIT